MEIKVSIGEVVDKYTILEIKLNNIKDLNKLENIKKEYDYISPLVANINSIYISELHCVNEKLWLIEDKIREKELKQEFDLEFIELARSIYFTNDERAKIKKEINEKYGSEFVEEKSYSNYTQFESEIEKRYLEQCIISSDINEHLPILKEYAEKCAHITEFGVRYGASTYAFLSGKPKKMISYDIQHNSFISEIVTLTRKENLNFFFEKCDVLEIEIEETDLLFIDTYHTYNQLINELKLHGDKVRKYIILHDTFTYGLTDEEPYAHSSHIIQSIPIEKTGLKHAITEFINSNNNWVIDREYLNNNGLTILKNIIY